MTLTIGLIIAAIVMLGLGCVLFAALIVGARADEMADPHGDVVEVPKR